ncbi:DUF2254 domain-containing protein [Pantoea sp. C2G6]|uniref:DUF2254 domain-containing protein n=1 Tax=Pantoea sp. C2G6 TaxID=3243084 RepID=UPI003ED9DFE8
MTSRWRWLAAQLTRRLWFRTSLFAVLAVITALVAAALKSFMPPHVYVLAGNHAVDEILGILASSMLAVTTFSLNIMVSAYNSASSSVTPRATRLLVEDRTTQNVLATFIGSFLYSLVGIIALNMGIYGSEGRVILFFVTLGVIVLIVITLLRWINHLAQFGHMGETTQRVEDATAAALRQRLENPYLGATPWHGEPVTHAAPQRIFADQVGYVQHIDMPRLAEFAEKHQLSLYIHCQPGSFVHGAALLAEMLPARPEVDPDELHRAFTIGPMRSFDQDPRFGLCVLSEIASRALSPAVNDPGTAIDVTGRALRLLSLWRDPQPAQEVTYPRLFLRGLASADLIEDVFGGIARDGSALPDVQIRLQKALLALAALSPGYFGPAARAFSQDAQQRAEESLRHEADRQRLRDLSGIHSPSVSQ